MDRAEKIAQLQRLDKIERLQAADTQAQAPAQPVDTSNENALPSIGDVATSAKGGAANTLLSGVGLAGDVGNWIGKKLGGGLPTQEQLAAGYELSPGEALRGALHAATQQAKKKAVDVEKTTKTGENRLADAVYTATKWGLPMGAASKLDLAVGGTAAGAEYATEQLLDGESELAQLWGLAPVGANMMLGLGKSGKEWLESRKTNDTTAVSDWFQSKFHDPLKALENIKTNVTAGRVGDIADLSEDVGAARIVQGVERASPTDVKLQGIENAREAQQAEELRGVFGAADPQQAQAAARDRTQSVLVNARMQAAETAEASADEAQRLTNQALTDPRGAAMEAGGELGEQLAASAKRAEAKDAQVDDVIAEVRRAEQGIETNLNKAQASKQLAESHSAYDDLLTEELSSPAWKAFDESAPINMSGIGKQLKQHLKTLAPKKIVDDFMATNLMRDFAKLKGPQKPKDVHYYVSTLKKKANNPNTPDELQRLYTKTSKGLDNLINTRGDGEAYAAAKAATVRLNKLLGGDLVQGAAGKNAPEQLGRALMKGDEAGATTARALLSTLEDPDFANPKLIEDVEEYIRSRAMDDGLDSTFLAKHGELLDVWQEARPEFVQKLENSVQSRQKLDAVSESAEQLQKTEADSRTALINARAAEDQARSAKQAKRVTKGVRGSQLTDYHRTPGEVVSKALTSEDPEVFKRLQNSFKTDADKAAFRSQVGEVVTDMFKRKGGLTKNPEHFERIEKHMRRLLGSDAEQGAKAFANVRAAEEFQKLKNRAGSTKYAHEPSQIAEDAAATLGAFTFMRAFNPKNALLITGLVKRTISRALHSKKQVKERQEMVDKLATEFITNPQLLVEVAEAAKKPLPQRAIDLLFKRILNPANVGPLVGATAKTRDNEE